MQAAVEHTEEVIEQTAGKTRKSTRQSMTNAGKDLPNDRPGKT
jgi:hypothetical protein